MIVFIPIYFIVKFKDPETKFNAIINTTFMIGAAGMLFALIDLRPSKKHEHHHQIETRVSPSTITTQPQNSLLLKF